MKSKSSSLTEDMAYQLSDAQCQCVPRSNGCHGWRQRVAVKEQVVARGTSEPMLAKIFIFDTRLQSWEFRECSAGRPRIQAGRKATRLARPEFAARLAGQGPAADLSRLAQVDDFAEV